jgi:Protein of unknown function (DUF3800)
VKIRANRSDEPRANPRQRFERGHLPDKRAALRIAVVITAVDDDVRVLGEHLRRGWHHALGKRALQLLLAGVLSPHVPHVRTCLVELRVDVVVPVVLVPVLLVRVVLDGRLVSQDQHLERIENIARPILQEASDSERAPKGARRCNVLASNSTSRLGAHPIAAQALTGLAETCPVGIRSLIPMYLAFVDESGNVGLPGSRTYTLGCLFLDADAWPDAFDRMIALRRELRNRYGLPVRAELKANYLLRGKGPLWPLNLSEQERHEIYLEMMRVQAGLGYKTYAIVINKQELANRGHNENAREVAWEFLVQRLERLTTTSHPQTTVMIVHDEGESAVVRKIARKARRAGTAGSAFGTGYLNVPARLLVDDPVPRDSRQSYFVQLADLSAYAAFRRIHPPPARHVPIVPQTMWDELGAATYTEANYLARLDHPADPPGIVSWPRV